MPDTTAPAGGPDRPWPDTEAGLWAALRDVAARADPLPPAVRAAAVASLGWLDPDAALARLVADSAASPAPAGVRGAGPAHLAGAGQPRLLTFSTAELTIELEASRDGRWYRLTGQLVPAGPARLGVDHRAGHRSVAADPAGRFAVDRIEPGPVRLTCTPTGGELVRTAWVLL